MIGFSYSILLINAELISVTDKVFVQKKKLINSLTIINETANTNDKLEKILAKFYVDVFKKHIKKQKN